MTTTPVKKTNGKAKGNTFERKMANLLSDRFQEMTGKEKGFRRNPDSGSYFGGMNKRRTQTHDTEHAAFGDLICPTNFLFSIECKHYKSAPTFTSIIAGEVKQWDTWIAQAQQDAASSNRKMMLVIKYNNVDEFVLVDQAIDTLEHKLKYKGKLGYTLKDVLALPNTFFFNTESEPK